MAEISAKDVMELRNETGLPMMKCKEALQATEGDKAKAKEHLRKLGERVAEKKVGRATNAGIVASYMHHNNSVGVMVELSCETDFVARNEAFMQLGRDIAMHIAALKPKYLDENDIPEEVIAKEKEILRERFVKEGKPEKIVDKIVEGSIKKFYEENCLLYQPFAKAEKGETVLETVKATIGKIGENMGIRRFVRWEVGEE
jgi:elongation factor Ts